MTTVRIDRLSPVDLINVHAETPSAPARVGAIAFLDGRTLLDAQGNLRMADIRAELERRLGRTPRLRQVIHPAGLLAGRPVWIDDAAFRIDRHVREVELPMDEALTDFAIHLVNQPMATSHPLWRMWFVRGLPDHRTAFVIALHHVIADGVTTVRLIGALTDDADAEKAAPTWSPQHPPTWAQLVRDNLQRKASGLRAGHRPDLSQWREVRLLRHAPRTALNRPVSARRRLGVVTMDLAAAKQTAHAHGGKVNDVVLALATGGLRQLLLSRGEPVEGVRLNASVAVSLRESGSQDVGNRSGVIVVRVPLDADPHRRLREIARDSARAKKHQMYTTGGALLIGLARFGLLRYFSRHQHMVNFVESNVTGPAARLRLLGAPIVDVVPIGTLVGNLTVGVLALSYAGRLTIAVQADAVRCPDLDVLLTAMHDDSVTLTAGLTQPHSDVPAEPIAAAASGS